MRDLSSQAKPKWRRFWTIQKKTYQAERVLENRIFASRVKTAISRAITFIKRVPNDDPNSKDNLAGNTADAPQSTAQLLLASREHHSEDFINVVPPPNIEAGTTGAFQTVTPAATSPQPSSEASLRPFLNADPTKVYCIKAGSPAKCIQNRLGTLLALSWMISPAFAAEDNAIPTSQPSLTWPFNEGPPGLWDFVFAIVTAFIIVAYFLIARFKSWLNDPARGWILLGIPTVGCFLIMSDVTTSLTTLLSAGALQLFLGQNVARMRYYLPHDPHNHWYTMSIHFWPLIFALTVGLALLCMKASPTMYSQKTQLPWFPFTIPCFGVAVATGVYLGYTLRPRDVPILPQFRGNGGRSRSA